MHADASMPILAFLNPVDADPVQVLECRISENRAQTASYKCKSLQWLEYNIVAGAM